MQRVEKMTDSTQPQEKKAKRSAPLTRVTAEERAKQFKDHLYADDGVLFAAFVNTALILNESTW